MSKTLKRDLIAVICLSHTLSGNGLFILPISREDTRLSEVSIY